MRAISMEKSIYGNSGFHDLLPSAEQEVEASVFCMSSEPRTEPSNGRTASRVWLNLRKFI